MNKKIKIWATVMLAFIFTVGCTDSFEEINTDPDAFDEAPYTNMLADMIREVGERMGNDMDGYGTWAGYIVKIQYLDYMNGVIPTNNTYGNRWSRCYTNLSQSDDILARSEENAANLKNIRWVARIWQQYNWSYLLDGWGDIPYSEALKAGDSGESSILQPKYDKQEDIFPAVLAELKVLADEMSAGLGNDPLGDGDFIYKGDMSKWQKFCNSLRLRIAMRISGVAPELARTTIEEIFSNPSKYPFIDSTDEAFYLWWQGTPPYYEPWYSNSLDRDEHGLSDIFIDHLKAKNDPRIAAIAHPAESDGEYRGFANGPANMPSLPTISRIGAIYRDDPAGFTPFYKASESYFIMAEAAMNGWNVGTTAEEAYEKAVRMSMSENGIATAEADAYLAAGGKFDNTKNRIWEEMWVSLFKNNYEAWALYRRTGVPTTNYIAIESVWKGTHNDQPFRLPYPNNEYLYNSVNCQAAAANIENFCWGEQLWWDTRTGVY